MGYMNYTFYKNKKLYLQNQFNYSLKYFSKLKY